MNVNHKVKDHSCMVLKLSLNTIHFNSITHKALRTYKHALEDADVGVCASKPSVLLLSWYLKLI